MSLSRTALRPLARALQTRARQASTITGIKGREVSSCRLRLRCALNCEAGLPGFVQVIDSRGNPTVECDIMTTVRRRRARGAL